MGWPYVREQITNQHFARITIATRLLIAWQRHPDPGRQVLVVAMTNGSLGPGRIRRESRSSSRYCTTVASSTMRGYSPLESHHPVYAITLHHPPPPASSHPRPGNGISSLARRRPHPLPRPSSPSLSIVLLFFDHVPHRKLMDQGHVRQGAVVVSIPFARIGGQNKNSNAFDRTGFQCLGRGVRVGGDQIAEPEAKASVGNLQRGRTIGRGRGRT